MSLGALLLLAGSTYAQVDGWKAYRYFNLVGGLNDGFDPTAIAPNEASDLQNVVFTTGGAVSKRSGFAHLNSSAEPSSSGGTTGVAFYKQADGTRYLVRVVNDATGDKIEKMDYGVGTAGPDGTWDDITGATAITIGNDNHADFTFAQNDIVIEDGVGTTPPNLWTGTGNATVVTGSPPNAKYVAYHKNHLWAAGDTSNPSRLSFSQLCSASTAPGCIQNWTATDVFDVETQDGQIIRGIKSGLDALYVWKDNSIWRVTGTDRDTFQLEQMVRGTGTLSGTSIVIINNQFVFLTAQHQIAVYDGGITVQILSVKIEGTLGRLNLNRLDNVAATSFNDGTGDSNYYACVSTSSASTNDQVLVYNTFHKAWTKFSGINCNAITTYEIGTQQQAILFGDYSGFTNRYPTTDADAGAAINAYYQSGQLQLDIPQSKDFKLLQFFVQQEGNYDLTTEYRLDFAGSGTQTAISLAGSGSLWDSATWDDALWADVTTTVGRVDIGLRADFLQWKISNANASEPFVVKGIIIWALPSDRIGGVF